MHDFLAEENCLRVFEEGGARGEQDVSETWDLAFEAPLGSMNTKDRLCPAETPSVLQTLPRNNVSRRERSHICETEKIFCYESLTLA